MKTPLLALIILLLATSVNAIPSFTSLSTVGEMGTITDLSIDNNNRIIYAYGRTGELYTYTENTEAFTDNTSIFPNWESDISSYHRTTIDQTRQLAIFTTTYLSKYIGVLNLTSGTYTDLTTDIPFIGITGFAIDIDETNGKLYIGSYAGNFGVYDYINNVSEDLAGTPIDYGDATFNKILVNTNGTLIYIYTFTAGGSDTNGYLYNTTNNLTSNNSNGDIITAAVLDNTHKKIYYGTSNTLVTQNLNTMNYTSVVFNISIEENINALDYDEETNTLFVGSTSGELYAYDINTNTAQLLYTGTSINDLIWDETLKRLYIADNDLLLLYRTHENPTFNITIYDTNRNLLNNETFTITTDGPDFTLTNTTSNARLRLTNLPVGAYSVSIGNDNYTSITFQFNAALDTNYLLDAYMTTSNNTVTFNVIDNDDNSPLETVSIKESRDIAGNLTHVETKLTDIGGTAQFNYQTGRKYVYNFSKNGYQSKTSTLNPITQSSYTIRLTKSSTLNNTPDFYGVSATYTPKRYTVNDTGNVIITMRSPYNYLTSYAASVNTPNDYAADTGTTAAGETLTIPYNLTNTIPGQVVTITINYTTALSGPRSFTYQHPINAAPGNNTIENLRTRDFGMGLLDKLLIATIMIGLIAGLAAMILGALPALLVAILFFGFFTYIGFIPLWGAALSSVLAFLLLARKGGD